MSENIEGDLRNHEASFEFAILYEVAAAAFGTSTAEDGTPTQLFTLCSPSNVRAGVIESIHFRVSPANAVTMKLRIYQDAIAADYESRMSKIFEDTVNRAKDAEVQLDGLNIPFQIAPSAMYFALTFSAAAGDTQGFIVVRGKVRKI